jgi:hypothetical protein
VPSSSQSVRRIWRHLRVPLVALHVVAIGLMATPDPGPGLQRSAWKNPTVQAEIQAWAERLNGFGVEVTPKALEAWAWARAKALHRLRDRLVRPFRPYHDYVGIRQPWNMFVAPHRNPAVLGVDILVDDEWTPLYRTRSDVYDYRRAFFDHDRIRAMLFRYGWPSYRHTYNDFARWLAKQIAVDVPEATKARIFYTRYRTRSPDEVKDGTEVKTVRDQYVIFDLAVFRPEPSP